jgi:sugar lactone lactonase YvrE
LDRFFQPLASFDGVLPGLLIDLEVSPDGTVWVVNENGVASLKGSKWTIHFPDVMLWLAGFDDSGRTWLINEAGTAVLSWNGSEWQVYGDMEGWLPIRSQQLLSQGDDMVTDRAGRVWMTTFQDIRSFDGRNWTSPYLA